MAAPTLTHTAQRLYEAVGPLAAEDADHGYALAHLCAAVARSVDEVADLSRDLDDGSPGWSQLFDVDNLPEHWLAWTGQLIGVDVPAHIDLAAKRLRIKGTAGFRRGSIGALKAAATQRLTGNRTVYIFERHGGSPWEVAVSTFTSETPDPAGTLRDLNEQKPAGVILTHTLISGGDFNTLRGTHANFNAVTSAFASFDALRANPAGQ
jgi:hypothetical protein